MLNLPSDSTVTWTAFEEGDAAAVAEAMAKINANNFDKEFLYFEKALFDLQLYFVRVKRERKGELRIDNKKEKMLLKLKKIRCCALSPKGSREEVRKKYGRSTKDRGVKI